MDTSDLWKIVLGIVCLGLSAFFSASETSFIALPRVRLIQRLNADKPGASRVSRLLQRPEKLLATVLLSNNLVNTAAAALATAVAISFIDNVDLAILVSTVAVTAILLVFGEMVPKTLAWRRAETVAFAASRPLTILEWVFAPAVRLLQGISLLVSRALGITALHPQTTEEEIRTMISVGAEAGTMEPPEAEMLEKVFHFGDRQVQEIMTPRTEVVWVEKDTTLEDFLRIYAGETHTRFPVYEGDIENITGILSVKDILQTMGQQGFQPDATVADVIRPAYFVPETKLVGQMFSEMRDAGQQMAIVVDQYGGVAGLVTLKRLLEVIVGPVREEGEPVRDDFETLGENFYEVNATGVGIAEVNEELGLEIPEGSYQTLAGFILEKLGHIPQEGERLHYRDLCLQVTEMRRLKIERVQVWTISQPVEQTEA